MNAVLEPRIAAARTHGRERSAQTSPSLLVALVSMARVYDQSCGPVNCGSGAAAQNSPTPRTRTVRRKAAMRIHAIAGVALLGLLAGCASQGTMYSRNDAGK